MMPVRSGSRIGCDEDMGLTLTPTVYRNVARLAQPLAASIPITIFSLAAVSLPLAAAQSLGLSSRQTGTWLFALYAVPGLASIILTLAYRQPLLVAWHIAVVAFIASLSQTIPYPDLLGAMIVAGLVVVALGALGLTTRVAAFVPTPVVFGVVAGNVLPFVVGTFEALQTEGLLVGAALAAYLVGRRALPPRVPPILPALVVGVALAAVTGRLHGLAAGWTWPALTPSAPSFTPAAVLTVVPIAVPLIALHANLTAVGYLRSEAYAPPARAIEVTTGVATVVASLFGPCPVCMGALVTPLTAGPEAGERSVRPWAAYAGAAGFLLIALGAGVAADLPALLPLPLLLAVAGLALLGVLSQALEQVITGPLRLGPLVAFAVASSTLSLLGLGAAFWALAFGTMTSLLVEGETLRTLRGAGSEQVPG
jgi:benzoate membrane transport protein